jgi:hypothetical protein
VLENVSPAPPARNKIPRISSGVDSPPVKGRVEVLGTMTVVEVTTGTVVPEPFTGRVVVVITTVDAATR